MATKGASIDQIDALQAQRVYGLEVSSAGLAEVQDGRRVVYVPAAEIRASSCA